MPLQVPAVPLSHCSELNTAQHGGDRLVAVHLTMGRHTTRRHEENQRRMPSYTGHGRRRGTPHASARGA